MNAQVTPEQWPVNVGPETPSPRTGQLAAAFAKAQMEMQNPAFDAANPHFKSRFASLAAVRNAVIPCFAKHGIALTQDITSVEGGVSCITILMHASGQEKRFGPLILPVAKNDAQGFGSASTYARRYTMQSVAGVVGDDDDDGNAATAGKAAQKAAAKPVGEDVWTVLKDGAAIGEKALREAWKSISEETRDRIMDTEGARWEELKAKAIRKSVVTA
jgi:hypothetical protein